MANALFLFDHRNDGQQAADRLLESGLAQEAVALHAHALTSTEAGAETLDEFVTGGFGKSFLSLLEGLFQWGTAPHDAKLYEQVVQRGGAVLAVTATSNAERDTVDRQMATAGFSQRTEWSTAGTP